MRALLTLVLLLVIAAPAHAARVYGNADLVTVVGQPAESNAVALELSDDGRLRVTDAAGVQLDGDGCTAESDLTATCPFVAEVRVDLNTGPNLLTVAPEVTAAVEFFGGPQTDQVQGGGGPDLLYAGPGTDRLAGGPGDDLLRGHDGDDELLGGPGQDQVLGEAGFDDLDGGLGADTIRGGYDTDRLRHLDHRSGVRVTLTPGGLADAEDDVLDVERVEGTAYADVILGSAFDDRIEGGGGDDRLAGGGAADTIDGGEGADLLLGDATDPDAPAQDPASGGAPDTLTGGPGMDLLRGDGGRDELDAGSGDDVVDAREAESTQEVRDEGVACGDGLDRALLDWNDEPIACEELLARARPGAPPPVVFFTPPVPGPGPQPVLGRPRTAAGAVLVPVHCERSAPCRATVRLRELRTVRAGRRTRSRAGRVLRSARATIGAGSTQVVSLGRPRRARVLVELRIGRERWSRPLVLSGRALGS